MESTSQARGVQVAILGCGFMGTALLKGILRATRSDHGPVSKYTACVRTETSFARLRAELASHEDLVNFICNDSVQAAKGADVVILGFQPNSLHHVLNVPGMSHELNGKLIISLLAGKSCHEILDALKLSNGSADKTDVTRVIPSIGAQINESMSLIAEAPISDANKKLVLWLFGQVGRVQFVSEELLNTATAVSAACHALAVTAMDAIVDASVSEGIPRSTAMGIAAQCMKSSASLLLDDMTIEAFKSSMSVPYGITINAILQLDRGHVRPAISDAVRNAVSHSKQMGDKK